MLWKPGTLNSRLSRSGIRLCFSSGREKHTMLYRGCASTTSQKCFWLIVRNTQFPRSRKSFVTASSLMIVPGRRSRRKWTLGYRRARCSLTDLSNWSSRTSVTTPFPGDRRVLARRNLGHVRQGAALLLRWRTRRLDRRIAQQSHARLRRQANRAICAARRVEYP